MKNTENKLTLKKKFTLLEIVVAFFIFAIGVGFLLTQFSAAALRLIDSKELWKQEHELINAAEYALLINPSDGFDPEFFNPAYKIHRRYTDPDLKSGFENPTVGLQLKTLHITLYKRDGQKKLGSIQIDCWRDSECGEPKNEI